MKTIHVTRKHIREAHRAQKAVYGPFSPSSRCPLAVALRDQGYPQARVYQSYWRDRTFGRSYKLSRAAQKAVAIWDTKDRMSPFRFRVQA